MHELQDPSNVISRELAESDELLGKECSGCMRAFPYDVFDRDSSMKDGRKDLCPSCINSPRLSTMEHTDRLKELNFNSEATKRQRWAFQDDYRNEIARIGHPMTSGDLIHRIKKLVPNLYFMDGRIEGDIAVFLTGRDNTNGKDFEYLWYIPEGLMPEYSIYEFEATRDIIVREKMRGWRTPLLRLIKRGLLSEEDCNKEFGYPLGPASTVWHRTLWAYRNGQTPER